MSLHAPARILLPRAADAGPGALERALAELGYATLPVEPPGADLALAMLDASAAAPDAVQLASQVRSLQQPGRPLMVLLGDEADAALVGAAYDAGATDVLSSPVAPGTLRAKLAYVMQAHATRTQLQATLAAAELATWSLDVASGRVTADALLAHMFGVSPQDANGGPLATYLAAIHPDDSERTAAQIALAIEDGRPYDVAYRVRDGAGQQRSVIARGQLSRGEGGRAAALQGIVIDVSAQKQAEAELRESEERYQTLFDSVDVGICIIDMLFDADAIPVDYRFVEINPAFVKHTGLADVAGKSMRAMVPDHDEHWFHIYGKVATSGQPVRFIDEARALNRWFDVYATRVGGPGSRRLAVLFTDISERVQADAELRRLADDMAAADRRKNEFLATLAHELRNPLAPIRSGLQVLRMAGSDPAANARVHDIMERQLTYLVALVDDLLDVARITHGQIELRCGPVDLAGIVAAAIETARPLIDAEQHELVLDLPDCPLPLQADSTRLRQVLGNLLNNAAKYTPRGGRIVLSARLEGGQVLVRVADNGIGIAAASLGSVFDMFNQVGRERHRARGGLGIGLSLVRSLVEKHGGSVDAASAGPGHGSVFTVRLPLAPSPAPIAQAPPAPFAGGSGMRVLVVDDNEDAAATLAELLELTGHTVRVANGGAQAVVQAADFPPQVVFLDIGMPGMNGYQTARALRADGHQAALLVALTGWGGDEDRERTREAGFDHHLTKPVDLDAVLQLLAAEAARLAQAAHAA